MTNKEIAERGMELLDGKDAIQNLRAFFNELDPPKPQPVVWWRVAGDKWYIGIVEYYNAQGVYDASGTFRYFSDIEWKPARILADDEVAGAPDELIRHNGKMYKLLEIPPVSEWPIGANEMAFVFFSDERKELEPDKEPVYTITRTALQGADTPNYTADRVYTSTESGGGDASYDADSGVLTGVYWRTETSDAEHKARQYDAIVEALNVADGGQYRNDTIAAIERIITERDRLRQAIEYAYREGWQDAIREVDTYNHRESAENTGWDESEARAALQGAGDE
jgi:hypothetical protein